MMLLFAMLSPSCWQCPGRAGAEEMHTPGSLCPASLPGHEAAVASAGGCAVLAGASSRIAGFGGVAA